MWSFQAVLEVSRTVCAAAICLYFLGALLKQVETRKRNAAPFFWLLVTMLLVSVTEAAIMIVQSGGFPNIQPMAATLLYILGLLLQIDHLWTPINEEKNPAWHALLGSWTIMAVFELLAIIELTAVPRSSSVELVATSLRCCPEVILFIVFAWPNGGGYIQLGDNDNVPVVEGSTTIRKRPKLPALKRSVRDEIRAAGGTWPWVKKFRIFLPWIWPSGMPWMILRIVIAQLLQQVEIALEVYTPYADGAFMETIVRAYTDRNLIPVWKALGLLLGIRLANSGVGICTVRDLLWQSFEQFRKMRAESSTYAHLINHEAAFHDVTSPIDIIDASDMGLTVCRALDFILLEAVPLITQFIGASITVFSLYGAHVALVQVVVIAIYTLLTLRWNRILMPIYDERMMARQNTRRRREGGLKGWRTVALYDQTSREIEAHATSLSTQMKLVWKSDILRIGSKVSSQLVLILGQFAATVLVILREFQIGGTVGSVVAFSGYWSLLRSPLQFFIHIPERIIGYLYDADRLRRIMEAKSSMKYGPEDLRLAGGRVEFKNVTYSYISSVKPIFKKLNLVIEPGKTTAIIGPSGIGKTTLLNLIIRFYDPQEGSIEIDGQDVRTLQRGIVSRHVAVMAQSPHLFNDDTVGDNIRYGRPNATVSEMHEAAKRAGIHPIIMALDKGYDAMMGEGGGNFSGGERQRVALARTLMQCSASVMLFDEATSALDADSEAHVKKTIKADFAGRTTVIIAHRLSSIMHADKIIVFKKGEDSCGEIAEEGKHDELLKQNGIYARLWRKHIGVAETEEKKHAEERAVEELFEGK